MYEASNYVYNFRCVLLREGLVQVHLLELDQLNCFELLNQWSDTTNSLVCDIMHHTYTMIGSSNGSKLMICI